MKPELASKKLRLLEVSKHGSQLNFPKVGNAKRMSKAPPLHRPSATWKTQCDRLEQNTPKKLVIQLPRKKSAAHFAKKLFIGLFLWFHLRSGSIDAVSINKQTAGLSAILVSSCWQKNCGFGGLQKTKKFGVLHCSSLRPGRH